MSVREPRVGALAAGWIAVAAGLVVYADRCFRDDVESALAAEAVVERIGAVLALGERGASGAWAIPRLVEALDDPRVSSHAVWALGEMGEAAKPAIPALVALLDQVLPKGNAMFIARLAVALRKIDAEDTDVAAALRRVREQPNALLRKFAGAAGG